VLAHSFGLIKADGAHHTYGSDESTLDDQLYWNHFVHFQSELEYENRTDLNMVEIARFKWKDADDVIWFAADLANGVGGDEVCRKKNRNWWDLNRICNRARVRFNENLTRRINDLTAFEIVCHEFGHTLGFQHRNSGCMIT